MRTMLNGTWKAKKCALITREVMFIRQILVSSGRAKLAVANGCWPQRRICCTAAVSFALSEDNKICLQLLIKLCLMLMLTAIYWLDKKRESIFLINSGKNKKIKCIFPSTCMLHIFYSHPIFLFSSFLSPLFLCLFSFITMTTDCKPCCWIFSLWWMWKVFPPYFFQQREPKSSPVTHSCSYLYSALLQPRVLLLLDQRNAYLNAYQPFSSPE